MYIYFRIFVKKAAHFQIAEVPDLGIHIYWDMGTRISLQVDNRWKNNVREVQ